jgi:DNA polymerase elongation subunit (family B)
MDLEFIPIDYSAFDWQDENYVKVYGRSRDGRRVCIIDQVKPYIWVILKDNISDKELKKTISAIEKIEVSNEIRTTKIIRTQVHEKKFLGSVVKAIKVFITNYKDAAAVADRMDMDCIDKRREHDLGVITRYIMDRQFSPFNWFRVSGELLNKSDDFGGIDDSLRVDIVIKAESIVAINDNDENHLNLQRFSPKIIAYDIETDEFEIGKGKILMISLYGDGGKLKKVLTFKPGCEHLEFIECLKDEKEMLERFSKYIVDEDPDILAGYFSDNFDLPYIKERCKKLKVSLPLGLDNSSPKSSGAKRSSVRIEGIVHLDVFKFISINYSQYLQSETLSLNEVASELLGEKKLVHEFKHSSKLDSAQWEQFFKYNLHDSLLTYKLSERIWPDLLEFCRITHKPLYEMSRDGMSTHVEDYILHNLYKFDEIAEKRPIHDDIGERRDLGKYEGAFVLAPKPGLYDNVVFFDFTSMYGSVAVTYNLSKSTLLEKKDKDAFSVVVDGQNAYFSREQGFFLKLLEFLIIKRKEYKEVYKKSPDPIILARSNAFKLIANAAYGYQGFFGARYYCREAAAGITAMSRAAIHDTIDKISKAGFSVIYSDTDSIAFESMGKSRDDIMDFLHKLNTDLPGIMELDLEDFYTRGLWVTTRGGEIGAKKKYALITNNGKMKIRGFETVRRDWCPLARRLQNDILKMILTKGNHLEALNHTKEIIKNLKERKIDKSELAIKTQLKKDISGYKSKGPHVIAAQKMVDNGVPVNIGMLIEYFIADPPLNSKGKPLTKRISDRVALPDEDKDYDISYYLNNQVLPAVENILQVFGVATKDIIEGEAQKRLF